MGAKRAKKSTTRKPAKRKATKPKSDELVPGTYQWKCYACNHVGPSVEFEIDPDTALCPREHCKSEDVFPHRTYRCNTCGHVGGQEDLFGPEAELLDEDPFEVGLTPSCQKEVESDPDEDRPICGYGWEEQHCESSDVVQIA